MQEHISLHQYIRHPVSADGDCGYTSFGITRQHAYDLLSMHVNDIVAVIGPAVRSALLSGDFFNYLHEEEHIGHSVSHEHICNQLEDYAANLNIVTAYLKYDILDKRIDLGWAHPAILQALAKIQGINIFMWRQGEDDALIPHQIDDQNYAQLLTPDAIERLDLLFINNNHFERLEFLPNINAIAIPMDIEDESPSDSTTTGYKSQLLLGEADFSYAVGLVKKHIRTHPEFGSKMIATCYESEASLRSSYRKATNHIDYLLEQGVTVLYGVDARNIHEHPDLAGKLFDCIHFNFPHDKQHHSTNSLKNLIAEFYLSAKQCQQLGGRVYMALPRPPNQLEYDKWNRNASNFFYKALSYNIYDNSRNSGYRLVKKRMFSRERYPEYHHVQTGNSSAATVAERFPREYIFENTSLTPEEILTLDNEREKKPYRHQGKYIIPELITDNDTTDYFLSDNSSPKLFAIHDAKAASVWVREIHTRMNQLLDKSHRNISISNKAIRKFRTQLQSVEIFLLGSPTKSYYTHPSGLNWKNSVMLWHYRSTVDDTSSLILDSEKQDVFYQYLNCLDSIVKKCTKEHDYLSMTALEALFYLNRFNCRSEKITALAISILSNQNIDWHCKLVAAAILMQQHHHQQIEKDSVISILFKQLGYDPRLDWLLCKYLGEFDLANIILDKQYHHTLNSIKDLRLIHSLLSSSDIKNLQKTKVKKLPNFFYREVAKFMHRKKCNQKPNSDDKVMEHAVSTPMNISIAFKRNLINWEAEISHTSLCHNIFMPCESFTLKENQLINIQGGLKDQHQLPSYLILARHYELGINGCIKDNREALSYFKLAADAGDETALAKIMTLFATGILDITREDPEIWQSYCLKAQKLFSQEAPEVSAYVTISRGIMGMAKFDLKLAKVCFRMSLQTSPQSSLANIYLAAIAIAERDYSEAKNILRSIDQHFGAFRSALGRFAQLYSQKKLTPEILANLLQFAKGENFSAIAVCFSIILKTLNEDRLSSLCIQWIIEVFPQHHYAQASLEIQKNQHPYELRFRSCTSRTEFHRHVDSLLLKANPHRGIVTAFEEKGKTEAYFINVNSVDEIENHEIILCTSQLLACTDDEARQNLITQLHELITMVYNIKSAYSKSLEIDRNETLTVLSEDEALSMSNKLKQESEQQESTLFANHSFFESPREHLKEELEPEDFDESLSHTH